MDIDLILWALAGGMLVSVLSAAAIYYQKDTPTTKQLGRDFILGAAFTGFLYPLLPETFDDMTGLIKSNAGSIVTKVISLDPGVQVGPPNF